MIAVYKRELSSYFKGVLGYLFSAFLLLFAGIYTMAYNLSSGYPNFEYAVSSISFIYLIAVPILSMRAIAEEKRQKTDQLLYALPLRMSSVVMGKYLAMVTVLAIPVAIMSLYPLLLSQFGQVHFPTAYGALIGFLCLGMALLAIGLFISSVTENQVSAAVICLAVMLLIYFITDLSSFVPSDASASLIALCVMALIFSGILYLFTKNYIVAGGAALLLAGGLVAGYMVDSSAFSGLFPELMKQLGLFDRFSSLIDGVFDMTVIVYDLSCAGVFLFLTVQTMEKRRWSE